jgi:hypothetical protein
MKLPVRILLMTCGTICIALAVLGLFLPLLPTTPFLLLAAACFARSSQTLHHWLLTNRWFGEYIRNYRAGVAVPLRRTIPAIALLWLTIGYTALAAVSDLWIRLILLAVAIGVTIHLVSISTLVRARRDRLPGSGEPSARKAETTATISQDETLPE